MTNSSPEKTSKSSKFLLPVFAVILLIAAIGYFVAIRSGLDKEMVEKALNQWGQQIEAYAKAEGEDIKFAYDGVEMAGGATSRHAVVKNPRFTVMVQEDEDQQVPVELTLSTESASIHPESVKLDSIRVELDKPILIAADKVPVGKITSERPIEVFGAREDKEGINYTNVQFPLPEKVQIESFDTKEVVTVTTQPGAQLSSSMATAQSGLGQFKAAINGLNAVDSSGKSLLSITALSIDSSSQKAQLEPQPAQPGGADTPVAAETEQFDVTVHAKIDGLMGVEEEMPYGAVSLNLDADYTGPLPQENETVDWATVPSHLNLKQLSVNTKDAGLLATADFRTGSGDLLPVGAARVKINNFAFVREELRRREALEPQDETILNVLLQRMVGTGLDNTKDLDVALKREKGGSLHMGDLTFEEALAIVLTGGKIGVTGQGSAQPTLEPGGQPQEAPATTEGASPAEDAAPADAAPVEPETVE